MKMKYLTLATFMILFLFACSKKEDQQMELLPAETTTPERPQNIRMPSYSHVAFELPRVPDAQEDLNPDSEFEERSSIYVDPGTDQLQDIINNASPGKTIKLRPGLYVENNTIVINKRLKMDAKEGAIVSLNGIVGIMITNAKKVEIKDHIFQNGGNCVLAIAAEEAPKVKIRENTFEGFPLTIVLEKTDKASVKDNVIVGADPDGGIGITAMNGEDIKIARNEISGNLFGIWACGEEGRCIENTVFENLMGIILCKVPEGEMAPFFSANSTGGSILPATNWSVDDNIAYNNVWGYILIDGAVDNSLEDNEAWNNAFVDIELTGVTNQLFGFMTPISKNNEVDANGVLYIDCGLDNEVNNGMDANLACSL